MPILMALIAAAAGILNTVQSGANASLNKALGQPILAALIVAATNAVVYLLWPRRSSGWLGLAMVRLPVDRAGAPSASRRDAVHGLCAGGPALHG